MNDIHTVSTDRSQGLILRAELQFALVLGARVDGRRGGAGTQRSREFPVLYSLLLY